MNSADLALSIRHLDASTYALDARCTLSDGDGDIRSPVGQHLASFDFTQLRALSLDSDAYGKALSDSLFADAAVRNIFAQALAHTETKNVSLRLRLAIDANAPELHSLRWELLRHPLTGAPLSTSERILFSRYLSSQDWRAIAAKPQSQLRALVVIANPTDLAKYNLTTFDTQAEYEHIASALATISISALKTNGQASLNNLTQQLRDGCDILYLVAHGRLHGDSANLWLEKPDGTADVIEGNMLVTRLAELPEPPRLVVLASCQSAKMEMTGDGVLAALGPRLAASGVAAVVAMQGNITLRTLETFMPTFFRELQRDGVIDRAVATARGAVREQPDAWMLALFMRLKSGNLWREAVKGLTVEQSGGVRISGGHTVVEGDIVGGDKAGRDIIRVEAGATLIRADVLVAPGDARECANLRILLNKVKQFWIEGVLEKSLYNAVLLELGKEVRADAVEHPWESVLELPNATRSLPRDTNMGTLFNQMNRALLILGEPGSGKTITLLELARDLATRAEQDPDCRQPIPVVFNLSSWAEIHQPLMEWLIAELSAKYQIPKKIGREWLEQNRLTPLLDGLDEVRAEQRAACVEAINTFGEQVGLSGLVVCCRLEQYTQLPVRLKLNAAIVVQPLTHQQIDGYLTSAGSKLGALRATLQTDETLRELAQSPLMLSIMSLAYQDASAEALVGPISDTVEERRRHLFNNYIERMFKRKGQGSQLYSAAQTLQWLAWLARQMTQQKQTVFLIEQLQPSWLSRRIWRWTYLLGSRLMGGLILGMSVGLLGGLLVGLSGALSGGLLVGLLVGLLGGLTIGLIDALRSERRSKHRTVKAAPSYLQSASTSLIFFLIYGLSVGLLGGLIVGLLVGLSAGLLVGLLVGLLGGLIVGLIVGLIYGLRGRWQNPTTDIRTVEAINWSWRTAGKGCASGLLFGLLSGLLFGLIAGLYVGLSVGLFGGLEVGLSVGLFGGLIGGLIALVTS